MLVPSWRWVPLVLLVLLLLVQLPMTARIVWQSRRWRDMAFAPLGLIRAFWRGGGMVTALVAVLRGR
ncbi:MAG: hypothetical protein A2W31_03265 [Planctomycetes bacterium RBG_16_64_10]|nr:MAG: hypothetical protein A2W31_03265 [Planctomycetes bacterium RBG_16_64_10]